METPASQNIELEILRDFLKAVDSMGRLDNSVSDSKIVKQTKKKIRLAVPMCDRCYCIRCKYHPTCTVCEISPGELVMLRRVYDVVRRAKKNSLTPETIQVLIENNKSRFFKQTEPRKNRKRN